MKLDCLLTLIYNMLQKVVFYIVKDGLSGRKRPSFAMRFGLFCTTGRHGLP